MATQIEKNTKKLIEKKLDALFNKQQQLNGDAGSSNSEGLPKAEGGIYNWNGRTTRTYMSGMPTPEEQNYWFAANRGQGVMPNLNSGWPQGGVNALNTMANNYSPNAPNLPIAPIPSVASRYGRIHSAGEASVIANRTYPKNFWDNTGLNPYNFYNNRPTAQSNIRQVQETGPFDFSRPPEDPKGWGTKVIEDNLGTVAAAVERAKGIPSNQYPTYNGKGITNTGTGNIGGMNQHLNTLMPSFGKYKTTLGKSNTVDNTLRPNKATPATPNAGEINWGKLGTFAGQIAPIAYNMFKGLQKPDKVNPNYNPYESQIRSLMANRRYNIEPQLNANLTAQAVSNRNIRNLGNSRGEMMSNLGAAQNYRMAGDAAAWATKNNMDNQYMAEQAQMDAGLGANKAQMDWNVQTAYAQNKAATNQFLGQGFNDLGRFSQTQQLMNNQQMRDAQLAGLYPDMFGVYNFMSGAKDIVNSTKKTKK